MPVTLYCDEHFAIGDATEIKRLAAAAGVTGLSAELFVYHDPGADDPSQLFLAAQRGWTILTRDRDFQRLHELWTAWWYWQPQPSAPHAGILWIGSPGLANADVARRVVSFLSSNQPRILENRMYVLEHRGTVWREYRPFG